MTAGYIICLIASIGLLLAYLTMVKENTFTFVVGREYAFISAVGELKE